jgi:hypothetical protein
MASLEQFRAVFNGSEQLSPGLNCSKLPRHAPCYGRAVSRRGLAERGGRVAGRALQRLCDLRADCGGATRGGHRARSHCRFVLPLIHFIPYFLKYSVSLFLKRQCDRTLAGHRRVRRGGQRGRGRGQRAGHGGFLSNSSVFFPARKLASTLANLAAGRCCKVTAGPTPRPRGKRPPSATRRSRR